MNRFLMSLYTTKIFFSVAISVLPIIISSIFLYKLYAVYVLLCCVLPLVFLEAIFHRQNISSGYSILLGVFLYLFMPCNIPLHVPIVASLFTFFVIHAYKDIGLPFNIASVSLCFVYIVFSKWFVFDKTAIDQTILFKANFMGLDSTLHGSELGIFITNKINQVLKSISLNISEGYVDIFLFKKGNIFGQTSIPLILFSFTIFYFIGYTRWFAILFYFLGFCIPTYIFGSKELFSGDMLLQVCSGGFLLGMFFIYNDINTTPIFISSSILCSLLTGFLVFFFRKYTNFIDGTPFAIAFLDIIRPMIDSAIFNIKRTLIRL